MAKTAKDFEQLASQIVELIGGKDNIAHAAHCLTRLRITPKDTSLVKLDEIKKLGVIGAQMIGDQVQVIIGNDITEVYEAFIKETGIERAAVIDENLDPELTKKKKSVKEILGSIFPAIVSCVFPILPALLACGMLQSIVMILVNFKIVPADSPTIATLTWIYNVAFWFLPVFVGSLFMMSGYLTGMAVFGAEIRDLIPENRAGQFQGVRIIGQVFIPGLIGPAIGAYILRNAAEIVNSDGTVSFLPDANIFLAALVVLILLFGILFAVRNRKRDA